VYDVGQQDGLGYIVSELVDGESLRALITRGPLPLRQLVDLGAQIADGLAAAHNSGIVHRDLKPENIMVTRDGRAKILDFGLAKQTVKTTSDGTTATALSEPGVVMGTVGYMSPEQVRSEPVDPRSDMCILCELAAGKRAFQGRSAVDVMTAILNSEPPELIAANATLPTAFDTISRRCLEKRREQRFQSASDLAFALRSMAGLSRSQPSQPGADSAAPVEVAARRNCGRGRPRGESFHLPLAASAMRSIARCVAPVTRSATQSPGRPWRRAGRGRRWRVMQLPAASTGRWQKLLGQSHARRRAVPLKGA
jgi:serine/threonine protein kinase